MVLKAVGAKFGSRNEKKKKKKISAVATVCRPIGAYIFIIGLFTRAYPKLV